MSTSTIIIYTASTSSSFLTDILLPSLTPVFSFIGALLAVMLTFYLAPKIYMRERVLDRKATCIEEIYSKAISIERDLRRYIAGVGHPHDSDKSPQRREDFGTLRLKSVDLQEYFLSKEIILDESASAAFLVFNSTLIDIMGNLGASVYSSVLKDSQIAYEQWSNAYQTTENKLQDAKKEMKSQFRRSIGIGVRKNIRSKIILWLKK